MDNAMSPLQPLRAVIQNRRQKAYERAELRQLAGGIVRTLLVLALLAALFHIWFGLRIVHGNQMYPALLDGDLTLTYRVDEYVKKDVIFYTAEGQTLVGRVVARSGDLVQISESGVLTVNGTPQTDESIYPTFPGENWPGSLQVPEGCVYVLGDYRINAVDSRQLGCIPLEQVQAKVIGLLLRHRGI